MISSNIPHTFLLTIAQQQRLRLVLDQADAMYDPGECLLKESMLVTGTPYHTTLVEGVTHQVHKIRESLMYAVALLDSGREDEYERGLAIIERVLSLQDTDPASRTYGIWSWFVEEPLEKMAPPDWNWADFCGTQLLEVALTHGPFLDETLQDRIRTAILHAARSIERRNVAPDYTNIAIMGSFVTMAASELYGVKDLNDYGLRKFRRFYEYTWEQGGFSEYNSPTYTITALNELGRIIRHVCTEEIKGMARSFYRRVWEDIANHFHGSTGQWSGPHSRSYRTLLNPQIQGFLRRAMDGRYPAAEEMPVVEEFALTEQRQTHVCPPDLEPLFFETHPAREFRQTFSKGTLDTVGTTCLTPAFSLGTINAGDLWNQRRACVAYWGTRARPRYLQVRFLHDDWDFAAAQFFSKQEGGNVLAGISFAVDGGDTHVNLDKIRNKTIQARDLRLRFEFGGLEPENILRTPDNPMDPFVLDFGDVTIGIATPVMCWDGAPGHWETGGDEQGAWLDVVLHHGPSKSIVLPDLAASCLAFAIRLTRASDIRGMPAVECIESPDRIDVNWNGLSLRIAPRPDTVERLRAAYAEDVHAPFQMAK